MKQKTETKQKKFTHAIAHFGSIALLSTSLMLASKAKAADSTNVSLSFAPKAIMRVYDNGQSSALGVGLNMQLDINKLSMGASASVVQTNQKPVVEETGAWIGYPLGPIYAVGYYYTDLFYKVGVKDPAFGLALKGYGLKLGAEKGKDFSDLYLALPMDGFTPGLVALEWDGKLQRVGISANTSSKLGNLLFKTETMFTCPPQGGAGSLQVRASVSYPF